MAALDSLTLEATGSYCAAVRPGTIGAARLDACVGCDEATCVDMPASRDAAADSLCRQSPNAFLKEEPHMEQQRAVEIVTTLAAGTDPFTGEAFARESILQHPDVVRALYLAGAALLGAGPARTGKSKAAARRPGRAGRPWSESEDAELSNGFDAGLEPKALALAHERTVGSIRSRLIKLGKIDAAPGDRH